MSYLEDFISSINYLPIDVTRSLELIRQLDAKAEDMNKELQSLTSSYFNSLSKDGKKVIEDNELLLTIRSKQVEVLNLSDEKVAISKQLIDMSDFQLKKLQNDLDRFSKELKADEDFQGSLDGIQKRQKMEKDASYGNAAEDDFNMFLEDEEKSFDFQTPIKQTYCYCNKPSYGEMIACDNTTCKNEWFHFQCVGLTTKPTGQWFCPDCKKP